MNAAPSQPYKPAELVCPGETLSEWLDRHDMTQAEFARRTSLTAKHINQVVKGSAAISSEVALAFERVTAIPARYWTQLEGNYQAAQQRLTEERELADHVDLVSRFPVKELAKRGRIRLGGSKVDTLRELLKFFAVANPDALEEVWLRPALYRRSPAFQADEGALAAWLRLGEIAAGGIETQPFDATKCRSKLDEMRALSQQPGIDWLEPLRQLCATVGIVLVVLKELPGCRINGATRWLSPDRAMVALSLRHRRNDIFWFTLFHEIFHILRHSKKETFIDTSARGEEAVEKEADAFAARVLIPADVAASLPTLSSEQEVIDLAAAIGVAPGIVVGRMQHDGIIPHNRWAHLITRYRFADD